MNVSQAVRDYVLKMIADVSGMKVIMFDKETAGIVSMVLSQSDILDKDVFLTEFLETENREKMMHLKAIVFVRPTANNVKLLKSELRKPHYGEYHIFFSNIVKTTAIEELAQGDEHEVVRQVQEYFADYFAVVPSLFSLNISSLAPLSIRDLSSLDSDRIVDGLTSVLLAIKRRPSIRFQKNSEVAEHISKLVLSRMERERELFHQVRRSDTPPLLLILDRRDDPVTPLLCQWTYQAMVHDLLGITNHRVSLSADPKAKPEQKEVVLASHQDDFFASNLYTNFGDLGIRVKELVDEYQVKHKSSQKIDSIADMQRFVESFPEFKKLAGNVSKHVSLLSEMSRLIEEGNLMAVSQLEQQLACAGSHSEAVKALTDILNESHVRLENKVRLVMLYALRYEDRGSAELNSFKETLRNYGADEASMQNISDLISYAGSNKRSGDLFSNKNLLVAFKRNIQRELVGVSNVYTQHKPLVESIMDQLAKNKLKETQYPFLEGATREKAQDVIIFFVGGATYEESLFVDQFNKSSLGVRVVLGGTTIHNSKSFLSGIKPALGMTDLR